MRVRVECDADVRVAQEFLYYLRVDALDKQQRGARVAQVVEAGALGKPRALQQGLEGAATKVVTV